MAELTNLEEKLAEVTGLAMAAQAATAKVQKLTEEQDESLVAALQTMAEEAARTEERCTELAGSFALVATARPEVAPERLASAVREHLRRAGAEPFAAGELERARNRILTQHCEGLQQLDQRADQISQLVTFFDDPHLLMRELERYRTLSAEERRAPHGQPFSRGGNEASDISMAALAALRDAVHGVH